MSEMIVETDWYLWLIMVANEINILRKLKHRHIVRYLGCEIEDKLCSSGGFSTSFYERIQ